MRKLNVLNLKFNPNVSNLEYSGLEDFMIEKMFVESFFDTLSDVEKEVLTGRFYGYKYIEMKRWGIKNMRLIVKNIEKKALNYFVEKN
jgi:hypothetical protein